MGEFTKVDSSRRREASSQHASHTDCLSELQGALQEATISRERRRQELDEASDRFYSLRSEGAKLQQSSTDAKLEAMELSSRLKATTAARRNGRPKRLARATCSASSLLDASGRVD